jgi:hypothetical protein
LLGTSGARPPFGPFAGDGVESDQRVVVAVDQEDVREEPIALAIQQDHPLRGYTVKLALGVVGIVQREELGIGRGELDDRIGY